MHSTSSVLLLSSAYRHELSIDHLQSTPVSVLISQRVPFLTSAARRPQRWDVHRLIIYTTGQADFIDEMKMHSLHAEEEDEFRNFNLPMW